MWNNKNFDMMLHLVGFFFMNLILIENHSTYFSHSVIISFVAAVFVVASLYDLQVN
jgi:hypothetical protein